MKLISDFLQGRTDLYVFICLFLLLTGCFENPYPPELTTKTIEKLSSTRISSGGNIVSPGGSDIIQKGICISLNNNPTLNDLGTIDGFGNDDFNSVIDLEPNNTYYIRAYAINGAGIGYGDVLSTTLSYANVVIVDFGNITGSTAFMRGRIESNQSIILRGACWNTVINPTTDDHISEAGSGDGIFETTLTELIPGTTYYTRAYAITSTEIFYSENYQFTTENFPQLTTLEINNAGTFLVSTGGQISSSGLIMGVGVCWSVVPAPTVEDNKTEDQLLYSDFYSDPFGLLPGETYYLRAYAINIAGVGYGNELVVEMPEASVYDIDGNPYSSVSVGSQTWLTENLRTTKYVNGDEILNLTGIEDWSNATSGAWSYYANQAEYEIPFGKLYNWYALTDGRKLCPAGWHVPTESDWITLIDYLGGSDLAGNALKETGPAHWIPNYHSTNSSGFTAIPGGGRSPDDWDSWGSYPVHSLGLFWSTTSVDDEKAVGYYLFDSHESITRQEYIKQTGLSVRCIKD